MSLFDDSLTIVELRLLRVYKLKIKAYFHLRRVYLDAGMFIKAFHHSFQIHIVRLQG